MRLVYQAELLSILFVCSLACGQESIKAKSQTARPPLELKLTKGPLWKDDCLELRVQLTNLSKSSIFLDAMYEGIRVYSSVSDATKKLGQGPGEVWMLVYGWTDVVSGPIRLVPGARRRNALCIADTFPVKETGKEMLRQVRVQGKLRIVAGYEAPKWRIIDQSLGKGRRVYVRKLDRSGRWTSGEVALEIPIPCATSIQTSDCLSPPQIFPGEHDVYELETEPPPTIDFQLPPPPIIPIHHLPPPKPN